MLRYGVCGCGLMGLEHIRNIGAMKNSGLDVAVTALSDPEESSLSEALKVCESLKFDPVAVKSVFDLLVHGSETVVDVVIVASPNHTHCQVLLDIFSISSTVHVLVEKPLCTTVEDCMRVIECAQGRAGLIWVGLEYRFMPPVARLIEEAHSGRIGRIHQMFIREHRFPFLRKVGDWNRFNRNSGGTLVEKCCHFFDLFNLVNHQAIPQRFCGSGGQSLNHLDEIYDGERSDIMDNAFVLIDYSNGVRACLDLCMFADATRSQEELSVVGENGKLEALLPQSELRIGLRGTHWIGDVETIQVKDDAAYTGHHFGASYRENLAFYQHITKQSCPNSPIISLHRGLLSVAMGIAAHRAIEQQRWVFLSEVLPEQYHESKP